MGGKRVARAGVALTLALVVVCAQASPAFGTTYFQTMTEWGNRNCGPLIAYTQARFNDWSEIQPPGSSTVHGWLVGDGGWHIWQRNGLYSGYWQAWGSNYLDYPNTYAGCRNYG